MVLSFVFGFAKGYLVPDCNAKVEQKTVLVKRLGQILFFYKAKKSGFDFFNFLKKIYFYFLFCKIYISKI